MRGHSEFIVHAQSWRNLGALKARLANKPSTLLFENHMFLSRILLIVLGVTCLSYLYLFVSSMAGTSLASEECQVWSWNCEACAGRRCILTISDNIQFVGIEWNWYILTSESVLKDKLCNIFHKAPKFEEELKNWILLDLFFILHMNIYILYIINATFLCRVSFCENGLQSWIFAIADPLRLLCTHWIRYGASNLWNLEKYKMHKTHCSFKVVCVCNYEPARLFIMQISCNLYLHKTHTLLSSSVLSKSEMKLQLHPPVVV